MCDEDERTEGREGKEVDICIAEIRGGATRGGLPISRSKCKPDPPEGEQFQ